MGWFFSQLWVQRDGSWWPGQAQEGLRRTATCPWREVDNCAMPLVYPAQPLTTAFIRPTRGSDPLMSSPFLPPL